MEGSRLRSSRIADGDGSAKSPQSSTHEPQAVLEKGGEKYLSGVGKQEQQREAAPPPPTRKSDATQRSARMESPKPPPRKTKVVAKKNGPSSMRCFAIVVTMAIIWVAYNTIMSGLRQPADKQDMLDKQKTEQWAAWRRKIDQSMAGAFPGGENVVARKIVTEALLRNERQYKTGMLKRAAVFHFGGAPTRASYAKMTNVITSFITPPPEGSPVLEIGEGRDGYDGLRQKIHSHLVNHPRSVVLLRGADEAPEGRLYDLEDAFENAEFEYGGKRTDCSKAIFVLESSFASRPEATPKGAAKGGLVEEVCGSGGGNACREEHRDALVRGLKRRSQGVWGRQAFVARVREVVPFVV